MTGSRARWAAMLGVAVAVSALLAATGWLTPASPKRLVAQDPGTCLILQAENEHDGAPTTLRLLSLPDGTTKRLTQAGYWINAMGYAAGQGVVYGVADGSSSGLYEHGAHAVRIDSAGTVSDLGVIGRAGERHPVWSLVTGATAGDVAGNRWYVRRNSDLYTVDIDPASADYLRVVHRTSLRPVSLAVGVDDFAYDPADGLLYGVSTTSRGDDSVVTLDPASGQVAVVPGLRFPDGGAYGSVVLASGAIYATANRVGNRNVTYRLPRDGSGPAVEVASGPALASSDAAGCLGQAAPPPPPPPPPPPRSEPVPPPRGSAPPPAAPVTTPGQPLPPPAGLLPTQVPPPPGVTPAPASAKPPLTMSSQPRHPAAAARPGARDTAKRTQEKRRWGLTALILVLGGGAAAAHVARQR